MKRFLPVFVVAIMLPLTAYAKDSLSADSRKLVAASNQFTLDLYKTVAAKDSGNLALSPFSVYTALLMTYTGARGETAAEMARVLHIQSAPDSAGSAFRSLLNSMEQQAAQDTFNCWSLANALWVDHSFAIRQQFRQMILHDFEGEATNVSFSGLFGPAAAVRKINEWVSGHTNHRITELLKRSDIGDQTRMILTNALWFKGKWAQQFRTAKTHPQMFRLPDGDSTSVSMMHLSRSDGFPIPRPQRSAPIRNYETLDFQLLEMPYWNGTHSMLVLLPRAYDGLPRMETALNATQLAEWIDSLSVPKVGYEISLPKAMLKTRADLVSPLQELGIRQAFVETDTAFAGISDETVWIDKLIHAAYVDINEQGTEAAAATGVLMVNLATTEQPFIFTANHPYLFLIRDNTTGAILFIGRVTDPSKG